MTNWVLAYDRFDPPVEGIREALCTLGNGFFAVRGAAIEAKADSIHYPGTYIAGGYNRATTEVAGKTIETEDLVNFPNWLPLSFRIGTGRWFHLREVEILDYHQQLNLRQGILTRTIRFRDREGNETRLHENRLVHMQHIHLAGLRVEIAPENWSGTLTVRLALDGSVVNAGVERYQTLQGKHLETLEKQTPSDDTLFLKSQTSQSHLRVAQAARTRLLSQGEQVHLTPKIVAHDDYIAHEYGLDAQQGTPITIEKIVALYTSRDPAISECGQAARETIGYAPGFTELAASHNLAWEHLWRHFDLDIEHSRANNDIDPLLTLRLHVFHLLQTASPAIKDLDTGVPARGLHGEAYRGHIFWDELFIFPLLNLRLPEITRALLMYRYRRLDAARRAANEQNLRGAMYPWQSGSDGREESQRLHLNPRSGHWIPDHSRLQRHVNAAVAYNVWQYFEVTGDMEFLSYYGAEMILEIARFWSSMASYNESLERFEILGVMGPDEYHDSYPDADRPGLNNNAYTNVMAVWVLWRALDLAEVLPASRWRELCELLDIQPDELAQWEHLSHRMHIPFHGDGIISQFSGYERLDELDWAGYREQYDDIQRMDRILESEGDSPNRYKLSKQADVLMLFYLFSAEELRSLFQRLDYPFEYETIPKNVKYYLNRTSHGSTLSRVAHSWVLARSDRRASWHLLTQALRSDVGDIQGGTTQEGIHMGAMAGTVDLVQRAYTGLEPRQDVLWLNPCLPKELQCLRINIRYRGQSLHLHITAKQLFISAEASNANPVSVGLRDHRFTLPPGEHRRFHLPLRPSGAPPA